VLGDQVAHSPAETFRQSFSMRCRDDLRRGVIGKVVCWEEHGGRPDIDAYSGGRFSVQRKKGTCTTLLRRQNSCHFRSGDGVPGSFEIDTGSSTALVLQRGFVEQHGLEARHPDGLRMKVGGIGGVFDTVATRLDRFDLAASKIERPVVEFPSRDEGGIPVAGIDGSIGYQILRQFVITFDYSHVLDDWDPKVVDGLAVKHHVMCSTIVVSADPEVLLLERSRRWPGMRLRS
jgi:hypothetical protein